MNRAALKTMVNMYRVVIVEDFGGSERVSYYGPYPKESTAQGVITLVLNRYRRSRMFANPKLPREIRASVEMSPVHWMTASRRRSF